MKKHILVIADYDRSETKALEKASDIASRFEATVEVIAFIDKEHPQQEISEHEKILNQQIKEHFDPKLSTNCRVIKTDDLVEWTRQYCNTHEVCLLIKTGKVGKPMFHTPTDWQLLRVLKCPVLIASTRKWKHKSNILAAVDAGCSQSKQHNMNHKVLTEAELWRLAHGHDLHAVYAVPTPTASLELDLIELSQFKRDKGPLSEQQLSQLIDKSGIGEVVEHVEFGAAEKQIPSKANEVKADLVIMGSVGRTGLHGLLVGNTAEKVMRNLRTDILVIKPD